MVKNLMRIVENCKQNACLLYVYALYIYTFLTFVVLSLLSKWMLVYIMYIYVILALHSKCFCILLAYGRSDKLFMQEFHVNAYS